MQNSNQNTDSLSFVDNLLNAPFAGVKNAENADAVNTLLDKFKLNWTVSKQALLLPGGHVTPFFGIVRDDNKTVFSTCKDSYQPFQNSELAEMLIRLSEKTGYDIHNGGSFNGGGKLYLQLISPNSINGIGANNDRVNGYLTGINSHDGTTSLKWGESNITISCHNTFMACMRELKNSARHTQSLQQRVEQAIRAIDGVITEEKSLFDTFIRLSEIPVTKESIRDIVAQITEVDITIPQAIAKDKFSTYSINRSSELLQSISKEMKEKGQTMWGLFSGVTQYTNYNMPVPKRENARLESIYTGSAFQINNDAYSYMAKLTK